MSTRTNVRPHSVITNGDMSASITSEVTILQSITKIGYSLSWAGTAPVGAASVQVSNDYSLDSAGKTANVGTWTTLVLEVGGTAVTSIPISGTPGNGFIDIGETAAYAMRLLYTRTSGSGTMNAVICGKVS